MIHQIRKETAQQIVENIKSLCNYDINYINDRGIIIASTDHSRIDTYHAIGMQAIEQKHMIEVSDAGSYPGIHKGVNLPITYRDQTIAAIGITGEPAEVGKYAELARRLALLILKEQDLNARRSDERSQLEYVIRSLVFHTAISPNYVSQILARHQVSDSVTYRTILLQIKPQGPEIDSDTLSGRILNLFRQLDPRLYCFNYPDEYILLLEESQYPRFLQQICQLLEKGNGGIKVGIGTPDSLYSQHQSYDNALLALQSLHGANHLASFEELDLTMLLASVPAKIRKSFLQKVITPLSEQDCRLLSTYFRQNCSLKRTCEELYMHKNTLQYKLERIHRLTGYDPREFRDAVILHLSMELISYASVDLNSAYPAPAGPHR